MELTLVHLQCHIGLDTLSWARLGASVTGIDFSPGSVAAARDIASRAGLPRRCPSPADKRHHLRVAALLSEIVQSLLDAGLTLTSLAEHRTIPWQALPQLIRTAAGWVLPDGEDRAPLTFSLIATKVPPA